MKKIFICGMMAAMMLPGFAQNSRNAGNCEVWKTQCGTPTGQEKFPVGQYDELPQHVQPSAGEWKNVKGTHVSWGSIDLRYAKTSVPVSAAKRKLAVSGWKGERVSAQAVIWTADGIPDLNYELLLPWEDTGNYMTSGFVRYVMTDELNKDRNGGCGERYDHTVYDSTMVADCIDPYLKSMELKPMNAQAVWVSCDIPRDAKAGTYKGTLNVRSGEKVIGSLALDIKVGKRVLPEPSEWSCHLDLWQNPYAVARYYQVPVWSKEHLDAMRPIMERLARAGQKVITTSIMHKPWNGQTEDYFESMVTWMRKLDGSWEFSFDVFDKWVEFMMSCGIDRQINCYSMVPWRLSFQYFDQATNSMKYADTAPGEQLYEEMWVNMLRAFSKHLKEKGWFGICTIAMDERPMDVMQKTIAVIRKADPDFKISLAGTYHSEIENDIYDYCIAINGEYPEGLVETRRSEGKISTLYTCCAEPYPNTFTFSPLAEAAWIGCHMAARNVDGYLRWAYNSWTLEPLLDSRFRTWAGGDTYMVYPGNRSSMRFERLMEGIQAYEKIRILREEYARTGNAGAAARLEKVLSGVTMEALATTPAEVMVNKVKAILD